MKDELGENLMKEFAVLRPKTCRYLIDDNGEDKKAKGTKNYVVKIKLKFEDYKHCLEATEPENRINQLEIINLICIVLVKIMRNPQKTIN